MAMRFAGDKTGTSFDPMSLRSAGSAGNYSAAAGVVDAGKTFTSMREKAPKYDALSNTAMQAQSAEKRAAMEAEANVTSAGMQAYGAGKQSQLQAQAAIEAAEIQAEASKQSSMMGAIGSIGSAAIGLFSDESTKDSITPIETALEKLRDLKPVTFYYKKEYGDSKRRHHGFIAQEFKQVLPDATYTDEKTGKLCIDPIDVIGLLVRGNQELQARVSRLEAKAALAAV
jgi:hypothetical protein